MKSDIGIQQIVKSILDKFRLKLKEAKYNGHYFDRKSLLEDKICDSKGTFLCEGKFNEDECKYKEKEDQGGHSINPYQSPEARILFSTWNLDHV